jgi:DNA (cytosine-5)-methyltransferase 1
MSILTAYPVRWKKVTFSISECLARKDLNFYMIFCRLVYDRLSGTFQQVDTAREQLAWSSAPPHNCPVCILQDRSALHTEKLATGVLHHGVQYHIQDFVLIRGKDGPCQIGQINWVKYNDEETVVQVRVLGRIADLVHLGPGEIKDEVGAILLCRPII